MLIFSQINRLQHILVIMKNSVILLSTIFYMLNSGSTSILCFEFHAYGFLVTIGRNRQFNFLPSFIFKDNFAVIATIFSCKDNLGHPVSHVFRYQQ